MTTTTKPPRGTTSASAHVDTEAEIRGRCIAEGLARAHRRMERFVAWLRRIGACRAGLRFALKHRSPEQIITAAADSEDYEEQGFLVWLFVRDDFTFEQSVDYEAALADDDRSDTCHGAVLAAARRVLASPEWAALPWQREAGR